MNWVAHGFWVELLGRTSGPLHLRLVIQPVVACVLAVAAGIGDAKAGRPAFLWAALTDPSERGYLLKDGWSDIMKLFTAACALDVVYQILALHAFRPIQMVVVASLLAVVPYTLLRGPIARLAVALRFRDS